MDADVCRLFAIGAFADAGALEPLGLTPAPAASPGTSFAEHALLAAGPGLWLVTSSPEVRDRAVAALGAVYAVVTCEAWNSQDGATIGRLRVIRHNDGVDESEMSEKRHPEPTAIAGLPDLAIVWLGQRVRSTSRKIKQKGPSKKELDHRQRAEQLLGALIERGALELAPASDVADLGDRTRRILFTIASTRPAALSALARMLGDSRHVARFSGTEADLRDALDVIKYRR